MADNIDVSIDGRGVASLTMVRTAVHNAFNDEFIADFVDALGNIAVVPAMRALVLRSAAKSFSAGADLEQMRRMAGYSEGENFEDAKGLADLFRALDLFPKPTIAAVNGLAFGGGVGLVAACDIAVGADSAVFALSEVRLGIVPAVIGPYVVAAIGERACRRYFLTGERFSAHEALRLGLLHQVVPPEKLDDAVEAILGEILLGGPTAQTAAKQLIADVVGRTRDEALSVEMAKRIAHRRGTPEAKEGISAFLERRKPGWHK